MRSSMKKLSQTVRKSKIFSDDQILILLGHPCISVHDKIFTRISGDEENSLFRRSSSLRASILSCKTMNSYLLNYSKDKKRLKHEKIVISRNSNLLYLFNILKGLFILYSVTSSLYFLAFNRSKVGFICDIVVWLFFLIDLLLQFFIETEDKSGNSIKNLRKILKLYTTRWLFIDLVSLLPLSWFENPNLEYTFRLSRILKLGFLFKLVNIKMISKIVATFITRKNSQRTKEIVFICVHMWDLINQISIMVFITYFLACLWHYYSDFIKRKLNPSPDFINFFHMEDDSNLSRMIKTWYFIFSTLTTAGFGDFYSVNKYEMIFNIFILVIGPSWFAFTTSKAFKSMNSLYNFAKNSNKQGELAKWISGVEMKHCRMRSKLKNRINRFFRHYWKNDRIGILCNKTFETSSFEEILEVQDQFLRNLDESLRNSVFEFLFGDLFMKFAYFFGRDSNWKYKFAVYLQPRVFDPGNKIIKIGENVNELLFIISGNFEILALANRKEKDKKKRFILVRKEKAFWIVGDFFIMKSVKAFFQYSAVDVVHSFAIPAFIFKALIKVASQSFLRYQEELTKNMSQLCEKAFEKSSDQEFQEATQMVLAAVNFSERSDDEESDMKILKKSNSLMNLDHFDLLKNRISRFRKEGFMTFKLKLIDLASRRISERLNNSFDFL